jgi:hypothetical protein
MKLVIVLASAAMLVLMACGGASGSPEDAVKDFIEAVKAGDGAKAAGYLSSYALEELDEQLEALKEDPEMAVMALGTMGVETTASEIEDWTSRDFFAALIETEAMRAELGDKLNVEVTGSEVEGDDALVFLKTVDGEDEEVEMTLENGEWKIYEMPD